MTTRLKLLCHASTSAVRTSAFPADEPLDMQGRQKLAVFPAWPALRADRYLTSPALRASQTAEILQLNATVEPMLRDCDYGRWTGRSFDEVQTQEPEAVAEWVQNPGAAPHGGEFLYLLLWVNLQLGWTHRMACRVRPSPSRTQRSSAPPLFTRSKQGRDRFGALTLLHFLSQDLGATLVAGRWYRLER